MEEVIQEMGAGAAEMSETVTDKAAEFEALVASRPGDEVISAASPWQDVDKVPGFGFTFAHAAAYRLTWDMIATMREAKARAFRPAIVALDEKFAIVRGFTRREYSDLQHRLSKESEELEQNLTKAGANQNWIRKELSMRAEEIVAIEATVFPKLDKVSIRSEPAGTAAVLAAAALSRSMLDETQQLPPLAL